MPSKKKPCPHPECDRMIDSRAQFCKRHKIITPEHQAKINSSLTGKKLSLETKAKISQAHKLRAIKNGNASIIKPCEWCGTEFIVKANTIKCGDGKFCSPDCAYEARKGPSCVLWNGGKIDLKCPQCSKIFYRTPGAILGNYAFCSKSCNSLYNKKRRKNKGTNIEIAMKTALQSEGICFEEQVALCNISIVDFLLPEFNIVIYCDGDYWHNLPKHKNKDILQNAVLETCGYKVLRFWGSEILADMGSCIKVIRKAMKKKPQIKEVEQLTLWSKWS